MPTPAEAIRAELPALAHHTYLNSGGAGPLARCAAAAIRERLEVVLGEGRMSLAQVTVLEDERSRLRAEVARLLSADAEDVAITASTTDGLNRVVWGVDWREGDEVVTTNLEHPGLMASLHTVARRRGVRLLVLRLESGAEDLEGAVGAATGPRTRLVALSHVAWATGARLDVEGASRAARRVGAVVLVDGAQAAGVIPVDPAALGADAYALPAQKWLLGPGGLGALWVRRETLDRLDCTFAGVASGTDHLPDGSFRPHAGARRLEMALSPEALIPGWLASLGWLAGLGDGDGARGVPWIERRTRAAVAATRAALEGAGATVLTPTGHASGLIAFTLDGIDPEPAAAALEAAGVIVRWVPSPRALRASIGFFTESNDIERLASAVADLTG